MTMTPKNDGAGRSDELAQSRDKVTQLEAAQHKGRRGPRRKVVLSVAGGLLAATATAGTLAYASIPSPSGNVSACYNATGTVRVIDTGAAWAVGETALNWSQTGPKGPGFRYRGVYDSNATYVTGDVVSRDCNGYHQLWYAWKSPPTGNGPCDYNWSYYGWTFFLTGQIGATGATGPQGLQGVRGPQGRAGVGTPQWARYNGSTVIASSAGNNVTDYYWQTGRVFLWFGGVADSSKCAITVHASDPSHSQPAFATFARYYGYILVSTSRVVNGTTEYIDVDTDVTVTC